MAYAVVSSFTGASKTTVTINSVSYDVYAFTSLAGGSIAFSQAGDVDYLVVAGGGPGGDGTGIGSGGTGGGGAGGLLTGKAAVSGGPRAVTVGAGGIRGRSGFSELASNGGNSSFEGIATAVGGGQGYSPVLGDSASLMGGGSGGGGMWTGTGANKVGAGTPGQGYGGAAGNGVGPRNGGSGGGAGGPAIIGDDVSYGVAGPGLLVPITGANNYYAGGGGGAGNIEAVPGGIGGGGTGAIGNYNAALMDGKPNTGGGGGGGRSGPGGHGGSGIVILRVATPVAGPSTPGPNKIDWTKVKQLKNSFGEVYEVKGNGFHWIKPI